VGGFAFDATPGGNIAFTNQQAPSGGGLPQPDDLLYYTDPYAAVDLRSSVCHW